VPNNLKGKGGDRWGPGKLVIPGRVAERKKSGTRASTEKVTRSEKTRRRCGSPMALRRRTPKKKIEGRLKRNQKRGTRQKIIFLNEKGDRAVEQVVRKKGACKKTSNIEKNQP